VNHTLHSIKILTVFYVLIILLFIGCKNEFEVNDDWKDITVVYGILNQADDTNYVKVTKCFLGDGDANIMAKVKDSLFYKNVDVVIEEWSNNILHNTIILRDTTFIQHNDVFSDTSIVFYTTSLLSSNYTYKLKIEEGGKEVTAETPLLEEVNFTHGFPFINLSDKFSREMAWYTKPNEKIFDVKMIFYYYEVYNDNTQKKDSIEIPFTELTSTSIAGNERMSIVLTGKLFLNSVEGLIQDNPNVNHRIVADSCYKFCFLIGAKELYNYIQVNEPTSGVVYDKPIYSNITNGIGLFSSRLSYKLPYKYKASEGTVNYISSSTLTQNLKFYNYSQTANIWSNYP
jgi:hypothetical protein